jgi:AcrR family transcriptional regulator
MDEPPTGRSARSRAAILQAALDLCRESSYAAVTMEAIATRARVGKPTVYRWWPSKAAVVLDALIDHVGEPYLALPDSGDFRHDLRGWLRNLADLLSDERTAPVLAGIVGTAQHDPVLATALNERIHLPIRARNQARILQAQAQGELPDVDGDLLEDLLIAPLWFRLLLTATPPTPQFADMILDVVLKIGPSQPAD